jgi:hypothetical protein
MKPKQLLMKHSEFTPVKAVKGSKKNTPNKNKYSDMQPSY